MGTAFSEAEYGRLIASIFERTPSFASAGAAAYKPGLERMRQMCLEMGSPQDSFPAIHIAGTNGKGSCSNMIAATFAARGLKVGLYTSPHILDFRERMRIVSEPELSMGCAVPHVELISKREVWDFMQQWDGAIRELSLSFFEITTAMAFWFFARRGVDLAVIETGLGGRLDATNIITPKLSLITNIGLDHTDLLGPTLAHIAAEKAGIIKEGVPVVIGESAEETDPVFIEAAHRLHAPIFFADRMGSDCDFVSELGDADLQGSYQKKNRLSVLGVLEVLCVEADPWTFDNAARICDFHGRWERVCGEPLTICDIGHNEHGLKYNFAQLEAMLQGGELSDLVMVYGSVSDKDVDAVLRILPSQAHLFFTAADNHRAMPCDELMRRAGRSSARAVPGVEEAVREALELCKSLDRPLLYIGGSTYVVSEALVALKKLSNTDK